MIKILIADDHAIVREGLKQILAEVPNWVVAAEAGCGHEVAEKLKKGHFDIVMLDISMPDKSGLDVLKEIKKKLPKLPVLILSVHPEEQYAIRVLKSGASGYLTKDSAPEELIKAIRIALQGRKYVSPSLAERLALDLDRDIDKPPHETLSDREYQVLCLLARGKPVKQIAKELFLSIKTISTYRTRILEKMGMKTTADLIQYAIKNSLIE
ncbi:MAG: response regulator transcription factor [Candidatus Aminicenantales bacterium]